MKAKYLLGCISALLLVNGLLVACGDDDNAAPVGTPDGGGGGDATRPDSSVQDANKPTGDAAGALTVNLRANYLNCPVSPIECGPGLEKGTFRSALWKTFPPPDGGAPAASVNTPDASFPLTQVIASPAADTYTLFSYLDVSPESPNGPGQEDRVGAPQTVRTSATQAVEANVALRDPPPPADAGSDADADAN